MAFNMSESKKHKHFYQPRVYLLDTETDILRHTLDTCQTCQNMCPFLGCLSIRNTLGTHCWEIRDMLGGQNAKFEKLAGSILLWMLSPEYVFEFDRILFYMNTFLVKSNLSKLKPTKIKRTKSIYSFYLHEYLIVNFVLIFKKWLSLVSVSLSWLCLPV